MATLQTVTLSWVQRRELEQARDHDARPYVRERCAALLKIADEDMYRAKLEHRKLQASATNQPEGAAFAA